MTFRPHDTAFRTKAHRGQAAGQAGHLSLDVPAMLGEDAWKEERTTADLYRRLGKRTLDAVVSVLLLATLLPLILILAALVVVEGGRPFFGHVRVGREGQPFRCWKIRTMVPDAEERLARLLANDPVAAAEWARDQKLAQDPRVTPLGDFLRRSSLDELPQFWNVIKGEMSLVGPRPVTTAELERYGDGAEDYMRVRPGVTGPWQVSGRNEISYSERVRLDRDYVRGLSLAGDLRILLETVRVVIARTGR